MSWWLLTDTRARGYYKSSPEARKKEEKFMSYDPQLPCQDSQNREDKGGYLFASFIAVGTDKKPCHEARIPAKETPTNVSEFAGIGTPFAVA